MTSNLVVAKYPIQYFNHLLTRKLQKTVIAIGSSYKKCTLFYDTFLNTFPETILPVYSTSRVPAIT